MNKVKGRIVLFVWGVLLGSPGLGRGTFWLGSGQNSGVSVRVCNGAGSSRLGLRDACCRPGQWRVPRPQGDRDGGGAEAGRRPSWLDVGSRLGRWSWVGGKAGSPRDFGAVPRGGCLPRDVAPRWGVELGGATRSPRELRGRGQTGQTGAQAGGALEELRLQVAPCRAPGWGEPGSCLVPRGVLPSSTRENDTAPSTQARAPALHELCVF